MKDNFTLIGVFRKPQRKGCQIRGTYRTRKDSSSQKGRSAESLNRAPISLKMVSGLYLVVFFASSHPLHFIS